MAKQEFVMTFNRVIRFAIVVPALILIGCEGQNTFQRTTNPTKGYQDVIDKSQTWKPGMGPRPPVADFDNRQFYCGQAFTFRIAGSGDKRAEYHEGVEGAVSVSVTTAQKIAFKVSLEGGPKGMTLKSLKSEGEQQLIWKPTREDAKHNTVKIVVSAPELQKACPYGFAEFVNVDVDPAPGAPLLSIPDLAQTIQYGPESAFTVEIKDPGATASKPPVISETGVEERMISNPESKLKNVGAKEAVFCEAGVMKNTSDPTLWTYKCTFKTQLLKDADKFIASPQTVNAVFFMKAKSARTELPSSQTSKSVQVVFPVIEKKKEEPKATESQPLFAAKESPKALNKVTPAGATSEGLELNQKEQIVPLPPQRPSVKQLSVKGGKK